MFEPRAFIVSYILSPFKIKKKKIGTGSQLPQAGLEMKVLLPQFHRGELGDYRDAPHSWPSVSCITLQTLFHIQAKVNVNTSSPTFLHKSYKSPPLLSAVW